MNYISHHPNQKQNHALRLIPLGVVPDVWVQIYLAIDMFLNITLMEFLMLTQIIDLILEKI
jgi:hypothetical protein